MLRRMILCLALLLGPSVQAAPSAKPDLAEFKLYCLKYRAQEGFQALMAPQIGAVTEIPTWALANNQTRFSFLAFRKRLKKVFRKWPQAYINKNTDKWVFPDPPGAQATPVGDKMRGIYYRGRVYIVDGHHRALTAIYLGLDTVPIHVSDDLSAVLTPTEFEEYLDHERLSYLIDFRGNAVSRIDFCDMADDPNLNLARLLIGRVAEEQTDRNDRPELAVKGHQLVLGLKSENDIPFLEFEIADALRRAGVEWDNNMETDIPMVKLRKFLKILKRAATQPGSRLKEVVLLDEPRAIHEIEQFLKISAHLQKNECQRQLISAKKPSQ